MHNIHHRVDSLRHINIPSGVNGTGNGVAGTWAVIGHTSGASKVSNSRDGCEAPGLLICRSITVESVRVALTAGEHSELIPAHRSTLHAAAGCHLAPRSWDPRARLICPLATFAARHTSSLAQLAARVRHWALTLVDWGGRKDNIAASGRRVAVLLNS